MREWYDSARSRTTEQDLPRGLDRDNPEPPSAQWRQGIADDPSLQYDPDVVPAPILLGAAEDHLIGISDDRHVLTIAGTRGGKGRSLIVPNLLEYRGSVLAIDPKAELASITSRRRGVDLRQHVFVLDPYQKCHGWGQQCRCYFNPLASLREDSPTVIEDAALIADALVVQRAVEDPHWDESARELLRTLILYVASYAEYEHRTLVRVRDILRDTDALEGTLRKLAALSTLDNNELHSVLAASGATMLSRPEREKESVFSTARRHTQFLDYPRVRAVLTHSELSLTFSLDALKKEPNGTTIYLCLPASRLSTCSAWLRLFVNLTLEALERERTVPRSPVLLCLDEFATLGHMRQIEEAAGQMAGFGAKLWPVVQDIAQLKSLYGERWETFFANSGLVHIFAANDVSTLDYISKRLGDTTIIMPEVQPDRQIVFDTIKSGGSVPRGSYEIFPLLTSEEVARYFGRRGNRILVLQPDDHPLALQRVNYDTHPFFAGKWDRWR